MDVILLFGPQAVGKMTVGEELEKKTGIPLFHNHMTIDLVVKFIPYREAQELIMYIREEIFRKVAMGDSKGIIFTFIWSFDSRYDWEFIEKVKAIFENENLYFIELESELETRLARNVTENRLNKKWTKRNIEWSNNEVVKSMDKHRMNSKIGEIKEDNYLRVDNTNVTPVEAADMIIEEFNLQNN